MTTLIEIDPALESIDQQMQDLQARRLKILSEKQRAEDTIRELAITDQQREQEEILKFRRAEVLDHYQDFLEGAAPLLEAVNQDVLRLIWEGESAFAFLCTVKSAQVAIIQRVDQLTTDLAQQAGAYSEAFPTKDRLINDLTFRIKEAISGNLLPKMDHPDSDKIMRHLGIRALNSTDHVGKIVERGLS